MGDDLWDATADIPGRGESYVDRDIESIRDEWFDDDRRESNAGTGDRPKALESSGVPRSWGRGERGSPSWERRRSPSSNWDSGHRSGSRSRGGDSSRGRAR